MVMSRTRYSILALALHWAIALALVGQFLLGLRLGHLRPGPEQFWLFQLHKSVGLMILFLSVGRLAVRVLKPRPAGELDVPMLRALTAAVHGGFYLVMIGGPLTGWLLVSTAPVRVPTLIFHILPWPHIPVPQGLVHGAHELAEGSHTAIAWLGAGLLVLHVLGVLRHQFLLRQALVERMLPVRRALSPMASAMSIAGILLSMALVGGLAVRFDPAIPSAAPTDDAGQQVVDARQPVAALSPEGTPQAKTNSGSSQIHDHSEPSVVGPAVVSPTAAPKAQEAQAAKAKIPEVPRWVVAPGGTLGFTAQWAGTAIDGQFSRWKATIRFDAAFLGRSSIKVSVDLASASTGDPQRDEMLKGKDFFDEGTYSTATFLADKFQSLGADHYRAVGKLELKGRKRPITIDFSLVTKGREATAQGQALIDRTAFGVGEGQWASSDQIAAGVTVHFSLVAHRKD